MKRLLTLVALLPLFLVSVGPAWAVRSNNTWECDLLTQSGITDPDMVDGPISGVSSVFSGPTPFCVGGDPAVTAIDMTRQEYDCFYIQVGTPAVATGATPAYTGTTAGISIYYKEAMTEAGLADAEIHPLVINKVLSAPDVSYMIPAALTTADYVQILFDSDCTAWTTVPVTVIAAHAPPGFEPVLVPVREGTFTMPAGGSGASRFAAGSIGAWPEGGKAARFQIISGISGYYTTDGTTPAAGTANDLWMATPLTKGETEARAIQWIPGTGAVTVRYTIYNRMP